MKNLRSPAPLLLPLAICIAVTTLCEEALAQQWNLVDAASPQSLPDYPCTVGGNAIAYDSLRGVTVYLDNKDTWEWDGNSWQQHLVGPVPTRNATELVFDSVRGVTVLFGGCDSSSPTDTWEWDGVAWTQVFPSTSPSCRWDYAAAFDSRRGVTVLFGGKICGGGGENDTWEYDGVNWTKVSNSGPAKRRGSSMCFDSGRGVCVLFGGAVHMGSAFGDTWEWDGLSWKLVATSGPSPRTSGYLNLLAYDSQRGVSVLYGGDGPTPLGDTWEWDGAVWTEVVVSGPPPSAGNVAYDSWRNLTVLHLEGQTWEYTGFDPALSAKPQLLSLTTGGIQSFTLDAGPQFGSEPYLLLGSLNGTEPGIPVNSIVIPLNANCAYFACSLAHPNSPPLSSSFGILDPLGRATASFTVPPGSKPSLAGLQLHHAFVALDTQAIPGAAVVAFASNAASLSILP